MQETKSNWSLVTHDVIKSPKRITLGPYASYWYQKTPRRFLNSMAYYKFATKMIGKEKRVLDIGCNEGLGTYVVAKECGFAKGIDFDKAAIATAKNNFPEDIIEFDSKDILETPATTQWDAVINFDVIEHILPENTDPFLYSITSHIKDEGLAIIGTPSLISQTFASEISKQGHINIFSPERLEETMKTYFTHVFMFAANDELIHTGFFPLAHYLIAVGCQKKGPLDGS